MLFKKKKEEEKIEKIVFFEVEVAGMKVQEAAVFTTNGVRYEDKETGIDLLYKLAKQDGIKTMEELKKKGYYEVVKEEMLKQKYKDIYNLAKGINKPESDKNTKEEKTKTKKKKKSLKEVLSKFKIKKLSIRAKFYALAALLGLTTGFVLGNKTENKDKENENNSTTEDNINNDTVIEDPTAQYETVEEMFEAYGTVDNVLDKSLINDTKKNSMKKIWSYLNDYNTRISNEHIAKKHNTKLAHTWDETVISYFAYNSLSQEEVNNVFDNYRLHSETFEEAYEKGVEQDILAYTVLTEKTNKADLINEQAGKDFYNKYEDLMIKYNKNFDKDNSEKIANEIIENIRKDFDITQATNEISPYKLSVIPIIQAFNDVTEYRSFENKLTEEEMSYFDKLIQYDAIEEKITVIGNSLNSYNIAVEALGEPEEEFTYSQIKNAAITELENNNAYYVDEATRNISNHKEYKEKFNVKDEEEKTSEESKEEKKDDNKKYDVDDAGMVEDEEEDKIPDWMLEEEVQEEIDFEDEIEEDTEEVIEVEEDTPEEEVIEVEEDTEYIPEDDTIKDITPDDTDVSPEEELPDPNKNDSISQVKSQNEVIADYIVDQMANNPTYTEEKAKEYTKK